MGMASGESDIYLWECGEMGRQRRWKKKILPAHWGKNFSSPQVSLLKMLRFFFFWRIQIWVKNTKGRLLRYGQAF